MKQIIIRMYRWIRYGSEHLAMLDVQEEYNASKKKFDEFLIKYEELQKQIPIQIWEERNQLENERTRLLRKAHSNELNDSDRNRIGEITDLMHNMRAKERGLLSDLQKTFDDNKAELDSLANILERYKDDCRLGDMS